MLKVALSVSSCITSELYYKCITNKFMSSFCELLFIQYSICEHISVSHCHIKALILEDVYLDVKMTLKILPCHPHEIWPLHSFHVLWIVWMIMMAN